MFKNQQLQLRPSGYLLPERLLHLKILLWGPAKSSPSAVSNKHTEVSDCCVNRFVSITACTATCSVCVHTQLFSVCVSVCLSSLATPSQGCRPNSMELELTQPTSLGLLVSKIHGSFKIYSECLCSRRNFTSRQGQQLWKQLEECASHPITVGGGLPY